MAKQRKIIQISSAIAPSENGDGFYAQTLAVCDDGTVWSYMGDDNERDTKKHPNAWVKFSDIPQGPVLPPHPTKVK